MPQENIQTVIKQIKQEFDRLREATDYIDQSKETVENVLLFTKETSNKLINKFEQIVDKVDKSYFAQSAEYKSEFEKFKQEIIIHKKDIEKSTTSVFNNLEKPINQFNDLSNKSLEIVKKIDAINFPERLDKLEKSVNSTIADISLANKELNKQAQELIEEIENIRFTEKFNEIKKEIQISIANIEKLNQEFENNIAEKFQIQNKKSENLISTVTQIDIPNKIKDLKTELNETSSKILAINEKTILKTEKLTKEIEEIHISSRLDKLDATIAGINQSIQSVLQRIDSVERNIKEGQQTKSNEIINRIEKTENKLHEAIKSVDSKLDRFEKNYNATTENNKTELFIKTEQLKKQNKLLKILLIITIVLSVLSIGLTFL
jgi:hypothetical protein